VGFTAIQRFGETGKVLWTHKFMDIQGGLAFEIQDDHMLVMPGEVFEMEITITRK
jgi:hypothetical protein